MLCFHRSCCSGVPGLELIKTKAFPAGMPSSLSLLRTGLLPVAAVGSRVVALSGDPRTSGFLRQDWAAWRLAFLRRDATLSTIAYREATLVFCDYVAAFCNVVGEWSRGWSGVGWNGVWSVVAVA